MQFISTVWCQPLSSLSGGASLYVVYIDLQQLNWTLIYTFYILHIHFKNLLLLFCGQYKDLFLNTAWRCRSREFIPNYCIKTNKMHSQQQFHSCSVPTFWNVAGVLINISSLCWYNYKIQVALGFLQTRFASSNCSCQRGACFSWD